MNPGGSKNRAMPSGMQTTSVHVVIAGMARSVPCVSCVILINHWRKMMKKIHGLAYNVIVWLERNVEDIWFAVLICATCFVIMIKW